MDFYIYLVNLTGTLLWMFPPIRQFGTRFFVYFLMFGFADWAGILYNKYINNTTNHIVYILVTVIAFISIQEKEHLKKYYIFYISVLILTTTIFFYVPDILTSALMLLLFHILITGTLFKLFLDSFFTRKIVSIFLAVMIFYEFTTITKIVTLLTGYQTGYLYFGLTTAVQLILGLFFSIFRYDNKRFLLQLK